MQLQPAVEDEFCIDGLFETVYMWFLRRVSNFHEKISSPDVIIGYNKWRRSSGYVSPELFLASIDTDYCKIRASVEAFPIDAAEQLRVFFENRSGNICDMPRPDLDYSVPKGGRNIWSLLGVPNKDPVPI